MSLRPRLWALVTLLSALLVPGMAQAHPHVWVETLATVQFDKSLVTALHVVWTFDEVVSDVMIADYDKNKNGRLDPPEIEEMRKKAFEPMKPYSYFTMIYLDNKKIENLKPEHFTPRIEKNILIYDFVLRLPQPVDPVNHVLSWSTYDESYYIDMEPPEKDPVHYEGAEGVACKSEIAEDEGNTIYYGMVHPLRVTLTCHKS